MYGRILRQLRESTGRSQAEIANAVAMSRAHLARLESDQRGLYVEDFVRIAEELGEKPGNLLPNDIGELARFKPLIDRLAAVPPELFPQVSAILTKVVSLAETVVAAPAPRSRATSQRKVRR